MSIEGNSLRENRVERKKFDKVVVFVSTMYPDDPASNVRVDLALQFFKRVEELGMHCVVVEGGSTNQRFLEALKDRGKYPNLDVEYAKTNAMGPKRREALSIAMEKYPNSYYMHCEPEKPDLITETNIGNIVKVLDTGADIVVPTRKDLDNYPPFQTWIEKRANKRVNNLLGVEIGNNIDMWFGPKVFNSAGAEEFLNYNKEGDKLDLWDGVHVPVLLAMQKGKRIVSVPVDFKYPNQQRDTEIGNRVIDQKRVQQYTKILKEFGDKFWEEKLKNKK